jgi:hypothetical protein
VVVQLTVNGAPAGPPIVIDQGSCVTADLGVYVEPCDVIGFQLSTSSDLEYDPSAADLDVTVMAQFAAPTPPLAVEAFIAGVLPALTGEFEVEVEEPGEIPANPFGRYRASELVLSDTDPVATWTDEGSGGNDLEATGSAQPTFEAAGFNGHPSVEFDGTDHWMQTAVYSAALSQPTTIIFMGEYITAPAATQLVCDGGTGGRNVLGHSGTITGNPWVMNAGTTVAATDTPVGKAGVDLCMVAIFDAGDSELHVNDGGDIMPNNPGTQGLVRFTLAAALNGTARSNIRVVEALVYDRAVSAAEIQSLQAYFTNTYS